MLFRSRVAPELLAAAGVDAEGELWGAMLDTKQSWDALVLRHAPDEETALRILSNRLYTNLTARFVQSHEYIAMERLYELHASGRYDLIVVDELFDIGSSCIDDALRPSMIARPHPLLACFSTAGDESSTVMIQMREMAIADIDAGICGDTYFAE